MADQATIMRALTIDDRVKAQLAELRKRAEENPTPAETMRERAEAFHRGEYVPSLNLDQAITIPDGYLVTFETEEHASGKMRHLSVSIDGQDKAPAPEAVVEIMRAFGFINVLQDCVIYPQTCEDGALAMHVIEPIDGNMQRLLSPGTVKPANDG